MKLLTYVAPMFNTNCLEIMRDNAIEREASEYLTREYKDFSFNILSNALRITMERGRGDWCRANVLYRSDWR